jgi:hypothetical protein
LVTEATLWFTLADWRAPCLIGQRQRFRVSIEAALSIRAMGRCAAVCLRLHHAQQHECRATSGFS